MTYHDWSSEWFEKNGEEFYKAICWTETQFNRWMRWFPYMKEKYGSMRIQGTNPSPDIDKMLRKNLYYIHYPKWYWFNQKIWRPFVDYTGIAWLIRRYQRLAFNLIIWRMLVKWPQFTDELCEDVQCHMVYGWIKKVSGYRCQWSCCNPITEEAADEVK